MIVRDIRGYLRYPRFNCIQNPSSTVDLCPQLCPIIYYIIQCLNLVAKRGEVFLWFVVFTFLP